MKARPSQVEAARLQPEVQCSVFRLTRGGERGWNGCGAADCLGDSSPAVASACGRWPHACACTIWPTWVRARRWRDLANGCRSVAELAGWFASGPLKVPCRRSTLSPFRHGASGCDWTGLTCPARRVRRLSLLQGVRAPTVADIPVLVVGVAGSLVLPVSDEMHVLVAPLELIRDGMLQLRSSITPAFRSIRTESPNSCVR